MRTINISALIPPPESVRCAAWECALVLIEEFSDRLRNDRERRDAGYVRRAGPDRLSRVPVGRIFRLFGRLVETRT